MPYSRVTKLTVQERSESETVPKATSANTRFTKPDKEERQAPFGNVATQGGKSRERQTKTINRWQQQKSTLATSHTDKTRHTNRKQANLPSENTKHGQKRAK